MTTFSVIVPCYNYSRFLPECIDSVLTQAGADVEVLIIDDASSDETPTVGAQLAQADGRVLFLRHELNRGHIATYNEGLDWASGDYTLLLSADDLVAEGAFRRAAMLMDHHPEVGLVYGRYVRFLGERPSREAQSLPARYRLLAGDEWIRSRCRAGGDTPIASAAAIVRTRLQHEIGGYRSDLPYSGDGEMWMRFAAHSALGYVDTVQAYVRRHPANMTHDFAPPMSKLLQQQAAFVALFERYDTNQDTNQEDRDFLHHLVNRALAREALWSVLQLLYRREADPRDVRDLLRFAVETYAPDARWTGGRSFRVRRAISLAMLLGPFFDGLSRWPRGWVNGRREAWRNR